MDDVRAKANAADTLVRYPDIKGLVGLWSYNGPAILNAVREAGKVGRVRIVAFDEADETLAGVKEGAIHATVVQQPYEFGYQAIMRMAQAVRGDRSFIPAVEADHRAHAGGEPRRTSRSSPGGSTNCEEGNSAMEPMRSPPLPVEPGPDRRAARRRIVAGPHRLRAGRPRARARVHPAVARPRRLRPARARRLPRASRPGDLHRRLRARLTPGRREGVPHRRRARGEGAWRSDHPLSGRQLRLRLQLARRRRSEGAAADRARAGVELARDESVRHQRLHRLVPRGRDRAAARHELRHRHRGDGGRLRRVLQPRSRHEVERPAAVARLRAAAQRALLVPGQRDGRQLADRPAAGARVRPQGARRRQADAGHRSRRAADRLRIERHRHVARIWSGIARCWRSATTRWTASRCTPTTAIRGR